MQMTNVATLFSSSIWGQALSYVQRKDVFIYCYYSANMAHFFFVFPMALRVSRKEQRQTKAAEERRGLDFRNYCQPAKL